ncbi:hypothetical protein [Actinocorallia longicatena]|uniref:hypothetical protein n=1 Tax=Actinocorallia longicatena TaxID=111803 RepID=UPI0031D0F7FE
MRGRFDARAVPAAIGVAVMLTLAVDVAIIAAHDGEAAVPQDFQFSNEVAGSPQQAKQITVAPLKKRYTPHLLIASPAELPADAAARAKRIKGVKVAEVVDGAQTYVAGRLVGLLGVDPSTFRNLAPKESAKLDALWKNVAGGDAAISFQGPRLGTVVAAGAQQRGASVRVGAFAALGVPTVQAIVSREQARRLGLAHGNAMLVSAPKQNLPKLRKSLLKLLPKGVKISILKQQATAPVQVAQTARSPLTGVNGCSVHMQAVRNEIDAATGPYLVIGCARPGDPQDHGTGDATDFMVSSGGRMPGAAGVAKGNAAAGYAISNWQRLGIKYVIWQQHIWNPSVCKCWRPMADRGSITQNHFDHVHISVLH